MENLKFRVTNLGPIKEGEIEQKPLTLFCGPNNSGKTWCMYSLHEFYDTMNVMLEYRALMLGGKHPKAQKLTKEELENAVKANTSIAYFNNALHRYLPECFNTSREEFIDTRFDCTNSKAEWNRRTENNENSSAFLLPAERNGLHLFYRELSAKRTALLHHASKKDIDINELLKDVKRSRYANPIARYIDWLNEIPENKKSKSDMFHKYIDYVHKSLIRGRYTVDQSGEITFRPYKIKGSSTPQAMDLHLTSSTVKSLFGLWFYLKHQAKKGDVLMIDEPELNIHPENQLKIARLLAQLVNAGLKVVISTHSDYIVREINNLIMLSQDKNGSLLKKYGYTKEEVLDPDKVAAYLFDECKITPFEIAPQDGIYATTFDDVITELNQTGDDIHYSLVEDE